MSIYSAYSPNNPRILIADSIAKTENFDCISDKEKEELEKRAETIKEKYNREKFGNDLIDKLLYYIYKTNVSWKNRFTHPKKLALFIMVFDPDCEIYKIYESNSNIDDIKDEVKTKFGFFDQNIIKAEKLYIERFYDMDDYSFMKKLEP